MENDDLDTSDSDQEFQPSSDLIEKLANIEDRLKLYPSYEIHLEKVNVLKDMKDVPRQLQAYEDFSKTFPLSSELWLGWISTIIEKEDSEDEVLHLFSTAVKDYLGVPIWVAYIDYATICLNDELRDADWVRKIYEEALLLPALHVKEGINIWKTAIKFEKNLYSIYKDDEESADHESKLKQQLDRVLELYHRMFSLPLMGNAEEFVEFKEWVTEDEILVNNIDDVTESFNNSEIKLLAMVPHEKKLERCSGTDIFKYEVYPKYIDYIQNHLDASTAQIMCLYERMIEQFPIEPSIWRKYLAFLKSTDNSKVLSVAERSVRNCSYSGKLRVEHIKALEQSSDAETVKELYDTAIEIPYEDPFHLLLVWKSYVSFLVKLHTEGSDSVIEMEKLYLNTLNIFNEYFSNHKSNTRAQFLAEWAEVKTNVFNDLDTARDIWTTKILVKKDKSSGKLWGKYLDFEKKYGTLDSTREAYTKAMACIHYGAEHISEKWLEFEKQNGNSEQLNEAIRKCEARLQNLGVEEQSHSDKDSVRPNKRQTSKNTFQPRSLTVKPTSQDKPGKRKFEHQNEEGDNATGGTNDHSEKQEHRKETETPMDAKNTNTYTPTAVDEHRTVFLSNLDFTVTEEDIKSVFEKAVGPIESVRLKHDFRGRSKGFGYIVYQSEDLVDVALKMDHTVIKGRPAFVSKYNANKTTRKHYFAYSNSQEKNKLFIRGLNFNTTKESLLELYSKYGIVKDVRLVTFRDGRSKGLAYIDFETEEMANKALQATDETELDSRKISVAISQPSLAADRPCADDTLDKIMRKSTTRLFIPSNVKIPQKKPKLDIDAIVSGSSSVNNTTSESETAKPSNTKTSAEKSAGLSNADFRNMLLKKK